MKTCYIVGASGGKTVLPALDIDDYLIAADGGLDVLLKMQISPNAVLGDFDSLGYVPCGKDVEVFPREKDDTDTFLAAKKGLEQGYRRFVIFGGLGGRADLEFANYQLLRYLAEKGCRGVLVGENRAVTAVSKDSLRFPKELRGKISVFAPAGADGVFIRGLRYTLERGSLESTSALGVSNEFIGKTAEIGCESGDLLIMWESSEYTFVFESDNINAE